MKDYWKHLRMYPNEHIEKCLAWALGSDWRKHIENPQFIAKEWKKRQPEWEKSPGFQIEEDMSIGQALEKISSAYKSEFLGKEKIKSVMFVTKIDNTENARDEYLHSEESGGCGNEEVLLTNVEIAALKEGKVIAISPQGEYDVFITLKQ